MTPKLEKIWTCPDCYFVSPVKLSNKCERYGKDHDAILIPHYSQSSLIELLKGRIDEYKAEMKGKEFAGEPTYLRCCIKIEELQSLLSMIEGK